MKEIQLKFKFRSINEEWLSYSPRTEFSLCSNRDKTYITDKEYLYIYYDENYLIHREDGYAVCSLLITKCYFQGRYYADDFFAKKTNHLICLTCNKFCKQKCF